MRDDTTGFKLSGTTDVDRLLDSTRTMYDQSTSGVRAHAQRCGDLILMRESNTNAYLDAASLLHQLAGLFPDIDGINNVAAAGLAPMFAKDARVSFSPDSPGRTTEQVHVQRYQEGTTKAFLFCYRGTYYLYSLASAATLNEMGNQDWTTLLIKILHQLRPRRLRSVSISRFVRNVDVAGLLLHACSRHVDEVYVGALRLEMTGARAPMDKLLFTMLALSAALERDASVNRLVAGKVNALRHNRWIGHDHHVPPGYRTDDDGKVAVAPEDRDLVRSILLTIAAEPNALEFVERLGALGLTTLAYSEGKAIEKSVAYVRRPDALWARMLRHVPLWATGRKLTRLPNPFPGAKQVAGVDVTLSNQGREELAMYLCPGLPEGGWAEPPIIDAAMAVAIRHAQSNRTEALATELEIRETDVHALVGTAAEHQRLLMDRQKLKASMLPLWSGTSWTTDDDTLTWELHSEKANYYRIVRNLNDRPNLDTDGEPEVRS